MGKCSWCCNIKVLFGLLILWSLLCIVSFVLAFVIFPDVLDSEISKATRLEEGTKQYDRFIELPFTLDFKVYIFNITNTEDVMKGAKPNLVEVGPFVYKQHRKKTIIRTDDEEDTITYSQQLSFNFSRDDSFGDDDQMVTIVNPPLLTALQLAEDRNLASPVSNCLWQTMDVEYQTFFITAPVKKLTFEGINFCKKVTLSFACQLVINIACEMASKLKNVETLVDGSLRFSFMDYKNTPDGEYTVKRGIKDISTLGHIVAWNDLTYTTYWGNESSCDQVKGSDSTIYPPGITTEDKFFIFATDICRTVEINYNNEESYSDINGYLFGTNNNTLQKSTTNATDDCYCVGMTKNKEGETSCFLDGVVDVQNCFGVPLLLSFPHFLWAHPQYLLDVDGLIPAEEKHKTFLIVEPNTGTPLKGAKRIQLNAVLRPIKGVLNLASLPKAILPMVWIDEGVILPAKYIDELNESYFDKVKLVEGFKWALVAIFTTLVITYAGLLIKKITCSKQ